VAISVIVLASGGLDSTACFAYYRQQDMPTSALWIDYGQPAARAELAAVRKISRHYRIGITKISVRPIRWPELGGDLVEFRGRNLTLVSLALNTAPGDGGLVALGIHRGTSFVDCSGDFASQADALLALLSDARVHLDCPFIDWTKLDIARYAAAHHVPIRLTYSCERGGGTPCKECGKCRERHMLEATLANGFASAGRAR